MVIPRFVRPGKELNGIQINILMRITSSTEARVRQWFDDFTRRHPQYVISASPAKRRNMMLTTAEEAVLAAASAHLPRMEKWRLALIQRGARHFITQTTATMNLPSLVPSSDADRAFQAITMASFIAAREDIKDGLPETSSRKFNGPPP
jgi:hypothetical protein